ncbi:MAG: response regulator [Anaeromyxobacter sp.]|nr:response regulator [Anaeromyxobacter sp.]MBL0277459.1 response regulator [Anaeromyxobacter sp.]
MSTPTGVLLVQRGVATQAMVDQAWREGKAHGERLCSRLLAMGVDQGHLAEVLSEKQGVPGVDLSRCVIDLSLLDLVPRLVADHDLILPLSDEGGRLHLAMSTPHDERVLSEVRFVTGREVSAYVCVQSAARQAITQAYDARERGEATWRGPLADPGPPPVLAAVLPPGAAAEPPEVEVLIAEDVLPELADDDLVAVESGAPILPGEDEPMGRPGAGEEVVLAVRAAGRRTVLVVDDEAEIRLLVQRALEKHGFAVEVAVDGAEALAKCEALVPDLVLLDAMLPKVHGFEACRRIKSSPRTRHVPVIMMTAVYRGWRFAQDAREAYGAEDYIEKPFRFDDVLRRIEAVLESTASRPTTGAALAAPHIARGKELLLANRLPEAQASFEAAIGADPWSAEAHAQLARTLRARGDAFAAMTAFERAAELRPGYLPALRALAGLYEEKGFRRKAAETLERALLAAGDEPVREAIKQDLLALIG